MPRAERGKICQTLAVVRYLAMKHLIVSREYPPAAYPPGGIGAYVANIARLMAEQGETVHVIGQRWKDAPEARESLHDGRLIVHRIGEDDIPEAVAMGADARIAQELDGLKESDFPAQWFAWHAAFLAERLIDGEGIDVVEGQDWEAPLYYLLLRRALGIGSQKHPPCIVHLHSPSKIIRHYNGAMGAPRQYAPMKRMEEFSINAADALLCPSHYFARQCREHFGLGSDRVTVIHLPVGFTPLVERGPEIWARGSICFVGRLEPRKGIIEWIEAAARVASEDSDVHFDFVGADIWGLKRIFLRRLPRRLRPRFRFHGSVSRGELLGFFARANCAVVPSRWENFPNVCIEAMSSGLPVIATRLGGMVELIEDGRSGWLAPDTGISGMVDGLAEALRRCRAASPDERASMGRAAAQTVREICNNERTVKQHIDVRTEIARLGAHRSLALGRTSPVRGDHGHELTEGFRQNGAGIVVRVKELKDARAVLQSIRGQTAQPQGVAVVCATAPSEYIREEAQRLTESGMIVLFEPDRRGADAWNAGFSALQARGIGGFCLFLDAFDRLLPGYLAQIEQVLLHRPDVGIVSPWTGRGGGSQMLDAPLCPDLEHQLIRNDVTPASAFRAAAIGGPPFRPGLAREYDIWELANRVLAKGWSAVTCPEILAQRRAQRPQLPWPEVTALRAIRAELLSPFRDAVRPTALSLVDDYVPFPQEKPETILSIRAFRYLVRTARHPRKAPRTIMRRLRKFLAANGLRSSLRGKGATS